MRIDQKSYNAIVNPIVDTYNSKISSKGKKDETNNNDQTTCNRAYDGTRKWTRVKIRAREVKLYAQDAYATVERKIDTVMWEIGRKLGKWEDKIDLDSKMDTLQKGFEKYVKSPYESLKKRTKQVALSFGRAVYGAIDKKKSFTERKQTISDFIDSKPFLKTSVKVIEIVFKLLLHPIDTTLSYFKGLEKNRVATRKEKEEANIAASHDSNRISTQSLKLNLEE